MTSVRSVLQTERSATRETTMMQQDFTPLLSITEFAARLQVTPACVRRWQFDGKIAIVKLGRLVRIPATEVDRLISAGLRPARSADSIPAPVRAAILEAAKKWQDHRRTVILEAAVDYKKRKLQRSPERDGNSTTKNGAE